jgi:hypothetical protein
LVFIVINRYVHERSDELENQKPTNLHIKAANFHLRVAQQRLHAVVQATYRQAGLPSQFSQQLDFDLKETNQGLARVALAIDKLARELDMKTAAYDRIQSTAALQAIEIERLRQRVISANQQRELVEQTNEHLQKSYQALIHSMEEEQIQREREKTKASYYMASI